MMTQRHFVQSYSGPEGTVALTIKMFAYMNSALPIMIHKRIGKKLI